MICSEDSSDRINPKGLDTSYILHRVIGCTVSWVKNAGDYWEDTNGDVHLVDERDYFSPAQLGGPYNVLRAHNLSGNGRPAALSIVG